MAFPAPAHLLRQHLPLLLVAVAILVAALVLQVTPEDRVALGGAPSLMVPPLCFTNTYLGIKCPGCGLTRSFVHLAQGDLFASFRSHRLGWLLAGLILAQIPYRLHEMARPGKARRLVVFGRWVGYVFVGLMLANWVGELLFFR